MSTTPTETLFYKTITYMIKNFKDVLINGNNSTFFFLGGGLPYANNDTEIITVNDCTSCENSVWDSMIAAKKIFPNESELIIPRKTWISGRIYKDFDDTLTTEYLNTDDSANNTYSMCIINSESNVYKCVFNNHGITSTDEPVGDYTIADGFIETLDGYVWKYMYNVKSTNKFLSLDWMPVPYNANNQTSDVEYNINPSYILEGSLNKVVVEYPGSGYVNSTITVSEFSAGDTYLQLSSLANVAANMSISGTGITNGTYISSISEVYNRIYLSIPTVSSGGGSSHPVDINTRVVITGDGSGCQAEATLSGSSIGYITVTIMGSGYTYADVAVYGTGSGFVGRSILPPKYGHGILPAVEFTSNAIMINKKFGEIDSTENGVLPIDISFRQYGIMINPHQFNSGEILQYQDADDIISQTYDLTVEGGSPYTIGSYVYQGPVSSPTFYGYVLSQDYYTIRIVNYNGTPTNGVLLTDGTIFRPVTNITSPGLEKYSGDIIYVKNINKVTRITDQAEEIRIIIEI